MKKDLLDVLACPICKGRLVYGKHKQELVCRFDKLAFPIRDNIVILVEEKARELGK